MDRMDFHHRIPVQIRFNDIDIVGHVNNAVYQEYFDQARLAYFKKVFGKKIEWVKAGFVIAGIQVDFSEPVYLDDTIFVVTRVERIGDKSLNMVQQVLKEGSGELAATARTVMVSFDYQNKKSIAFPEKWKERLEEFEGRKLS
jgi:acyl-CoA thioester hydrolase